MRRRWSTEWAKNSEEGLPAMNMKDIRDKAREVGVKVAVGWTKTIAIRAIQTAEGYEACFGRGLYGVCGQPDCCFRPDCEKIPSDG